MSGRQQCNMAASTTKSRKVLLCAVLFVLLTFPHESAAFGWFGGGDGDSVADKVAVPPLTTTEARKQVLKQRAAARKFKFHKLERIEAEDDDDDEENDDDDDNDDREEDSDSGEEDEDDNTPAVGRRSVRHSEAANSDANEDEEFQFERAHRSNKRNPKGTQRKQPDDDDNGESSFFGSLFGGLFGGGSDKRVKDDDDSGEDDDEDNDSAEQSNGIITWLKWFGERSNSEKPLKAQQQAAGESWTRYLNRWPFNSFFPIGQPPKPIRMPRRRRTETAGYTAAPTQRQMSQEYFESLLHRLPGFVVNATGVHNTECRQQLQIFQRQLRGNKLWTLQMLDATAKIPAGLLRGNINQFGDFELCTQAKTLVKITPELSLRIRGKYCLAHIEADTSVEALKLPVHLAHGRGLWNSHLGNPSHFVPRYAVANWGVCIPHLCPAQIVREMMEANLRPYNDSGVEFHVEVDEENDCYTRFSRSWWKLFRQDGHIATCILCLMALVLLVVTATMHEQWPAIRALTARLKQLRSRGEEGADPETDTEPAVEVEEAPGSTPPIEEATQEQLEEPVISPAPMPLKQLMLECLRAFSPMRTFAVLFAPSSIAADSEFPILQALRVGATFLLYLCLKFLMLGHLPLTNRDSLVRTVEQPWSILFRAPMLYADVLLLVSGFVTALQLSAEMAEKLHIQLLKSVAGKFTRYLPSMYVVLLCQTWLLPQLGSGPLWTNLIGQQSQLCEQQMWRNVFSVQNAIDFEETCSPITIQLALEVQLYLLLGPLLVWLFYVDSDAGFFAFGGLQAMSVAARYARTQREHLSLTLFHGINVSKFYRSANLLYASPISRATPYLLGIGAALLFRCQGESLPVAPRLVPVGWVVCLLSLVWCFWSPAAGMRSDFIYSASDAAVYATWCPLILGLALCWLVLMFPRGEGSLLRVLVSSRPVLFLSRIALPAQLVMYVVVLRNTALVKEAFHYQLSDLLNASELGGILLLATALAFLIEIPGQQVRRLLVNRIFVERPAQETHEEEPMSGGEEPSEAEGSDGEPPNCDTPEPAETVWGSDPEEEEQKYLTRRRSSLLPLPEDQTAEQTKLEEKKSKGVEKETEEAEETEEEEEEEEEDDEEEDQGEDHVDEEAEVKKRPDSPPPPVAATRRRRPLSED